MERKFTGFHQVRSTHLRQVLTTNNCHSYVTLGILLIIDSLLSLVLQVERRNQMVQVLLYLSYGRCVNWYLYIFPLNSADDVLWQTAMCSFKIPVLILKETFKNSSILLHVQCILLVFFSKKLNNDILAWWKYLNDKILNIQCTPYILRDGMLKFKYFIGYDCTWI